MKVKMIAILSILVAVVLVSGCTSSQPTKTYSGNGVSFNYPESWNVLAKEAVLSGAPNYSDAVFVVAVGNSNNQSNEEFVVNKQNKATTGGISLLFSGSTPQEWATKFKSTMEKVDLGTITEKTRTIDGVNANEVDIKTSTGGLWSRVYFTKNDLGYCLDYFSKSNDQTTADNIFNSFKVQ